MRTNIQTQNTHARIYILRVSKIKCLQNKMAYHEYNKHIKKHFET